MTLGFFFLLIRDPVEIIQNSFLSVAELKIHSIIYQPILYCEAFWLILVYGIISRYLWKHILSLQEFEFCILVSLCLSVSLRTTAGMWACVLQSLIGSGLSGLPVIIVSLLLSFSFHMFSLKNIVQEVNKQIRFLAGKKLQNYQRNFDGISL